MNFWRRALLAGVCAVAVASIYVSQPMLGPMGHDLGISLGSTGWIVAVSQIGYLVGLVLLVPLGDMFDRRKLIAGQMTAMSAGLGLTASVGSTWQVLTALTVTGMLAVVVQTTVAYVATGTGPTTPRLQRIRLFGA